MRSPSFASLATTVLVALLMGVYAYEAVPVLLVDAAEKGRSNAVVDVLLFLRIGVNRPWIINTPGGGVAPVFWSPDPHPFRFLSPLQAALGSIRRSSSDNSADMDGRRQMALRLLRGGANPNLESTGGLPLTLAVQNWKDTSLAEEIVARGGKVNALDWKGRSPLSTVCGWKSDPEKARWLLARGALLQNLPGESATPLRAAMGILHMEGTTKGITGDRLHESSTAWVELLLRAGADVEHLTGKFIASYEWQAESNAVTTVLGPRHLQDLRPLMLAANRGLPGPVRLLLEHGADPKATLNGYTALDYAENPKLRDPQEAFTRFGRHAECANLIREALKKESARKPGSH